MTWGTCFVNLGLSMVLLGSNDNIFSLTRNLQKFLMDVRVLATDDDLYL